MTVVWIDEQQNQWHSTTSIQIEKTGANRIAVLRALTVHVATMVPVVIVEVIVCTLLAWPSVLLIINWS